MAAFVPPSWSIYFGHEPFDLKDRRASVINHIIQFLCHEGAQFLQDVVLQEGESFWPVSFAELSRYREKFESFFAAILCEPEEALSCLGAAMFEALLLTDRAHLLQYADKVTDKIHVRLLDFPSRMRLKDLKASCLGRLVTVTGTVVRVSAVKPLVVAMDFACARCGSTNNVRFQDGRYSQPKGCRTSQCRSKTFQPRRETAAKVSFQKIRLQEASSTERHEEGRVPRTVDCELQADLVDRCMPGDSVTVCGVVKVINQDTDVGGGGGGRGKRRDQCLFHLYLDGVAVQSSSDPRGSAGGDDAASRHRSSSSSNQNNSNSSSSGTHGGTDRNDGDRSSSSHGASAASGPMDPCSSAPPNMQSFSQGDLEEILAFLNGREPSDLFRHVVQSFCPAIYSRDLIKVGITLALFGGVQKHAQDKERVPIRGDIHVLLVGDPGLGKSQLLKSAVAAAPRGVYVSGCSASSVGLTAAVAKDPISGDFCFEAGAMVLADRGTCCIDEFDKMTNEHQALLEAMEQQSVSVAKAGLLANLSARTSVIAAANPVGGHYNRAKTVNENLKMSAALLSRFDLIFILLDVPDEILDHRLSHHVMGLHAAGGGISSRMKSSRREFLALGSIDVGQQQAAGGGQQQRPLLHRIRLDRDEEEGFEPMPWRLLQKYIAYARQYVFPKLSPEAQQVLQQFYLRLRSHSQVADGTPITARQLESLVRLCEARARVELREVVTGQDAADVVELMSETLFEKLVDESGRVDFGRTGGMSKSKESRRFLMALQQLSKDRAKSCFSRKELAQLADDIALRVPDLDSLVEQLNEAGYILKKGPGLFEVQT